MGSFAAGPNADAQLSFTENGHLAGVSHYDRYPGMDNCEKPFSVEVTGVAVDPKTKWIWATHRPTSQGSCRGISMAITFQAWTSVFYSTQLVVDHGAMFSPDSGEAK